MNAMTNEWKGLMKRVANNRNAFFELWKITSNWTNFLFIFTTFGQTADTSFEV